MVSGLSYCRHALDHQTYVRAAALDQLDCFGMRHVLRVTAVNLSNLISDLLRAIADMHKLMLKWSDSVKCPTKNDSTESLNSD